MIAKYQMHLRLRNLANPKNHHYPNIEITADTLGTSIHCFFKYLKTQFGDHILIYAIEMIVLYVLIQIRYWAHCIHTSAVIGVKCMHLAIADV